MYKKKETAMRALECGKLFTNKNFDFFRNDEDVVFKASIYCPWAIRLACDSIKDSEVFLLKLIENRRYIDGDGVSKRLKNKKDFILTALKFYPQIIDIASPQIKALCQGQDPIEALTRAIESEKLHAELEQELSLPTPSQAIPKRPKRL